MSLPDGVAKIRVTTFNGGIGEWTGEVAPPRQLDIPAVPEPEAAAMLLAGLAVLRALRGRKIRQP